MSIETFTINGNEYSRGELRTIQFSSAQIMKIYSISKGTLKNWRRGCYFRAGQLKQYYREDEGFLPHFPSHNGRSTSYLISDVNEWIRSLSQLRRRFNVEIPKYLVGV